MKYTCLEEYYYSLIYFIFYVMLAVILISVILIVARVTLNSFLAKILTKINIKKINNNDTNTKYALKEVILIFVMTGLIIFILISLILVFMTKKVMNEADLDAKKILERQQSSLDDYKYYLVQVELNNGNNITGEVIAKNSVFLALFKSDNKTTLIPINHIKQANIIKVIKEKSKN